MQVTLPEVLIGKGEFLGVITLKTLAVYNLRKCLFSSNETQLAKTALKDVMFSCLYFTIMFRAGSVQKLHAIKMFYTVYNSNIKNLPHGI